MSHDAELTGYPDDADGAALADLAEQGVDMTRPLLIEFPVAVPDEAAANKTRMAMTRAGYDAHIDYDEGEPDDDGEIDPDDEEYGPLWTVFATIKMVPEYNEIIRIQADLDRLARPFGGNSEGWGAMFGGDEAG